MSSSALEQYIGVLFPQRWLLLGQHTWMLSMFQGYHSSVRLLSASMAGRYHTGIQSVNINLLLVRYTEALQRI